MVVAGTVAERAAQPRRRCSALAEGNRAYEEKFGFVYLVCATGQERRRDAREPARERMNNDRETELRIAAEEQAKITALRLEKLVL